MIPHAILILRIILSYETLLYTTKSDRVRNMYYLIGNTIRDTYESRIEVKQNRIMTLLTVVTTIFMRLIFFKVKKWL